MATIRILLGIICFAFAGFNFEPNRNILKHRGGRITNILGAPFNEKIFLENTNKVLRSVVTSEEQDLVKIASAEIGVREATDSNDGEQVERYLRYTGNRKGEPWCASFVSWVFSKGGYQKPKTAWSPFLFPEVRLKTIPRSGMVFGIYFTSLKRIGHCGFVVEINNNWVSTIEGNTNGEGGREGDGVYRKLRHAKTISRYADWLANNKRGGHP